MFSSGFPVFHLWDPVVFTSFFTLSCTTIKLPVSLTRTWKRNLAATCNVRSGAGPWEMGWKWVLMNSWIYQNLTPETLGFKQCMTFTKHVAVVAPNPQRPNWTLQPFRIFRDNILYSLYPSVPTVPSRLMILMSFAYQHKLCLVQAAPPTKGPKSLWPTSVPGSLVKHIAAANF